MRVKRYTQTVGGDRGVGKGVKSKQRIGQEDFLDDLDKVKLLIKKRFFLEEIAAMYDVEVDWARKELGKEGK